jgi:hypothetical protein
MAYETDHRLKSYLDTNQLHREQLALAILSMDKRFSEVRPRHPRGGPDGGRDIEAIFRNEQLAFGAVGFVNQADDSEEKKRAIRAKFHEDLASALSVNAPPQVFIFLTNVNLTVGDKESLIASAKSKGLHHCEIFDRERLRIALDSADGFAVRYQVLGIALSEAEQATFFAKWGDDINSVIATGFQTVQKTLDHLLFLQEAGGAISSFQVALELDRTYSGDEIGHFRAFCSLYLAEPKLKILSLLFGRSDKSERFDDEKRQTSELPGIKHGISGAQWEQAFDPDNNTIKGTSESDDDAPEKYRIAGTSSSIGQNTVKFITLQYYKHDFIRFRPALSLRDFDGCMFLPMLNRSLALKVRAIHVLANGYKLHEVSSEGFYVDEVPFEVAIPTAFDAVELLDPWVRIRPNDASVFRLSFSREIPFRMVDSRKAKNTLPTRQSKPD